MKEKLIFEEVFTQLIRRPHWGKLLIGGALSFIPIVNIFAFGYLYRFSAQLRRTGKIVLPEWSDWSGLFTDGLKFGVIWIVYWALPLLLVFALAKLLLCLNIAAVAYLLFTSTFFIVSMLFCSTLYRFHMNPNYKVLLEVSSIARMSYVGFSAYVLPILVFAGIFILALPLYGIAFFMGFLLLIAQSNSCYRSFELHK